MENKKFTKNMLNVVRENGKIVGFDISRKFWGTGHDGGELLNSEGKMCCLGFYSLACGASQNRIYGESYLSTIRADLPKKHIESTQWLAKETNSKLFEATNIEYLLAEVNDDTEKTYKTRSKKEARIKTIFAQNGITVNFVD